MSLQVSCRCGGRFAAPPHLAGQRVACPSCGAPIAIPNSPAAPPAVAQPLLVACRCGQQFHAPPHLAGQQVACPVCRQAIVVPHANASAPAAAQNWNTGFNAAPTGMPGGSMWDDELLNETRPAAPAPQTDFNAASALQQRHFGQLMHQANREQARHDADIDSWGTGKIVTGLAMTIGAVVWFVLGLAMGRIYFYPPVMFVLGVIALINGISQKLSR